MTWINRMNSALDYMESNLTERLDVDDIASMANTSAFHFQKMFHILTDVTLAEYIRKRRLTLAAIEIINGTSILTAAVKYGYETQASFTRAFKRVHGFTPGMTKEPGVTVKAYPPLTFDLKVQGSKAIDYEVRTMGEFTIAGEIRSFTSLNGQNYKDIPEYWTDMDRTEKIGDMMDLADTAGVLNGALLGACLGFSIDHDEFTYMIGMEPQAESELTGLRMRTVPAMTWAIFKSSNEKLKSSSDVWKTIYSEWFPATDYIHDEGPQLSIYHDPHDRSEYEIWIPVKIRK